MKLTPQQIATFRETVWEYFRAHKRDMPWRENPNPYYVLTSELMLQQTQVPRVMPKFAGFIQRFPDVQTLARASLSDVLSEWSGLGYNRRAKFLHEAAKSVVTNFGGEIPDTYDELVRLPGIGPNTAGAILAYAFNQPVIFIETNIRSVYIHYFFHDQLNVSDKQIRELVEQTLESEHPREFYWALMDYGSHLKQTVGRRLDQSKHYKKQSPLAGSLREMRGRIIKTLVSGPLNETDLRGQVRGDERFITALNALANEKMISKQNDKWCLTAESDNR